MRHNHLLSDFQKSIKEIELEIRAKELELGSLQASIARLESERNKLIEIIFRNLEPDTFIAWSN